MKRSVVLLMALGATLVAAVGAFALVPQVRAGVCDVADRLATRSECLKYAPGEKYAEFVAKAKANVTHDLHDPSSVQWRGLYISGDPGGPMTLCGELNAKNLMGAYVGFKPFFANESLIDTQTLGSPVSPVAEWSAKTIRPIYCDRKIEDVPAAP